MTKIPPRRNLTVFKRNQYRGPNNLNRVLGPIRL